MVSVKLILSLMCSSMKIKQLVIRQMPWLQQRDLPKLIGTHIEKNKVYNAVATIDSQLESFSNVAIDAVFIKLLLKEFSY